MDWGYLNSIHHNPDQRKNTPPKTNTHGMNSVSGPPWEGSEEAHCKAGSASPRSVLTCWVTRLGPNNITAPNTPVLTGTPSSAPLQTNKQKPFLADHLPQHEGGTALSAGKGTHHRLTFSS